jgi:hypothetical protein
VIYRMEKSGLLAERLRELYTRYAENGEEGLAESREPNR